ncbi:nuclear apoptosis-inducing factor 1-like [Scleropages formosus]|uniref:Nuclear apoptosis inducing factor 1 n=1 Tax=Scleropages formosus TaxID=113540 RepID=A0A8C9S1I5_SCLFO|nr:nuclear apoptosis-inducing factor 1-like [Scleropages formosus]
MASAAKKRKMNFSDREVEIIVEEIDRHKHVLVNHFNAGVTHIAKNNAWQEILKRVNAVTTCPRELAEVKKKWSDLKTEVRRKVAQARAAMDGTADSAPVSVTLTSTQQHICNLLGEATVISVAAGEQSTEISLPVTTVTLSAQGIETAGSATFEVQKTLQGETTYHVLEDGGMVEYCTAEAEVAADGQAEVPTAEGTECSARPQELKSRIALNSAHLLQEQRVTNLHVREIAQHLEMQTGMLQMIRRSHEVQACAQERQAQALEGTQATLHALVQALRPALKDLRKFLQGATNTAASATLSEEAQQPATVLKVEDLN